MSNPLQNNRLPLWTAVLWALGAIGSFHLAYEVPSCSFAIVLFLFCLFQLRSLERGRSAFYLGLVIGLAIYAPHLSFFWTLFGAAAIALWLVLAFWLGTFLLLASRCTREWGALVSAILIPVLWLGLEYFRSELYYLRFSWLNVGYTFQNSFVSIFGFLGVYGIGFLLASSAVAATCMRAKFAAPLLGLVCFGITVLENRPIHHAQENASAPNVAAVQLEFPDEDSVLESLDALIGEYPTAQLLLLSEYTFQRPVPQRFKEWCKENKRYLLAGGKEPAGDTFYNTAYVVGPSGDIVFQQSKSVPIQFFDDGLPAVEQKLWDSPWGKIGICICYDLSYRRVVDNLVRQGAQAIIVPSMDIVDWGERQHRLHGRVGPVRAAEYGIPLYRVCSSGISQFISADGAVLATAPFPGQGSSIAGTLSVGRPGRIPLDFWLSRLSVVGTIVVILLLIFRSRTRKHSSTGSLADSPPTVSSRQ